MKSVARRDVLVALRACRLWRSASDEAVRRLAASAVVEDVPAGASLVREGEPATRLGVLVSGKARVYHLTADGREIVFERMGVSQPLAAVAALAGGRYPASVEATSPAIVAWLGSDSVFALLAAEPAVTRDVVSDLAQRLVTFTSVTTALSLDVPQRLARYLFQRALAEGQASGHGVVVDLGMSKTDLAAALGTVPATLSRAFARLKRGGLIEVRARRVILLDVGALARLSEGYEEG